MPSKEEASDSAAAHSTQRNRRAGSFYSKTTSEVGDWVCNEGVLSLTWTLSGRTLDFIQKTIASEIEWKCEGNQTDLRFTRSGGSIYLPVWIIPKDPEELRLELIKKSREKEIKQQQEEGNARGRSLQRSMNAPFVFSSFTDTPSLFCATSRSEAVRIIYIPCARMRTELD